MTLEIESQRLTITTVTPRMARQTLAFYEKNRQHLLAWEDTKEPEFYTLARQKSIIRAENERLNNHTGVDFWLIDRSNGTFAGKIAIFGIIPGNYSLCVAGYKLDADYVGAGYMTEAMTSVQDFIHNQLGLRRIELNIMPRNSRSINLARRLGYRLECEIKEYIRINGVWEDHLRFVRTMRSVG